MGVKKMFEGYVLLDFSRPKGNEMSRAMSTMGAIQVFTSLSSAKEMAELCSGKGSSWTPVKIILEQTE